MSKKQTVFIFVLAAVLSAGIVCAQSQEEGSASSTRQQRIEEREELKNERKEEVQAKREERKCEIAQNRIQNKANQMQSNLKMHERVHAMIIRRLERLSGLLESKDLDVSTLDSYISTLSDKVSDLENTYEGFILRLDDAEEAACGQTKEMFRSRFQVAKDNVDQVKALRAEIREYISNTIKVELQRLRSQLEGEDENENEYVDDNQ